MALVVAPLRCLFTIALDIFRLKTDIAKTYCNNVGFNVLDNTPLVVYQVALTGHWLIMGLKTDNSLVDARLSKMEATIQNIASLTVVDNLVVNQLMECEVVATITTKVASTE